MIIFEPQFAFLIILHLAAAILLVAAVAHNIAHDCRNLGGFCPPISAPPSSPLSLLLIYLAVYILGAMAYPTFRVRMRAEYFDKFYPLAVSLFELKEHLASLGLAIAVAYFFVRKSLALDYAPFKARTALALSLLLGLALVYQILAGPYLVILKGIK